MRGERRSEVDDNSEMRALRTRLGRLEDRAEIADLVARYGRAVDDHDWATLAGLYTPDASFEGASGRVSGRAAVLDYYRAATANHQVSYHYPHSHEITIESEDHATGIVCAHAELAIDGDTVCVALRYEDDYRRVEGRWCFRERASRRLYAMRLDELPTGMADRLRIRYPGTEPRPAQLGADLAPEEAS